MRNKGHRPRIVRQGRPATASSMPERTLPAHRCLAGHRSPCQTGPSVHMHSKHL
jgi:hypothetical protein